MIKVAFLSIIMLSTLPALACDTEKEKKIYAVRVEPLKGRETFAYIFYKERSDLLAIAREKKWPESKGFRRP